MLTPAAADCFYLPLLLSSSSHRVSLSALCSVLSVALFTSAIPRSAPLACRLIAAFRPDGSFLITILLSISAAQLCCFSRCSTRGTHTNHTHKTALCFGAWYKYQQQNVQNRKNVEDPGNVQYMWIKCLLDTVHSIHCCGSNVPCFKARGDVAAEWRVTLCL